jgi:hypothetical protein
MQRHAEIDKVVLLAVLLESERFVALMASNSKQAVLSNSTRLCMPVKVVQPLKTKVVYSPAVLRDSDSPVMM